MRYKGYKYNPKKDCAEVSQNSGVDLAAAYDNMTLDGAVEMDATRFNKIDDPDSILGKPADIFEAAHLKESISHYEAPAAPVEE